MTHSVTTGLSVEHSQKLADSLGLSLGGNLLGIQATLSGQLQQEFGLKLDITSQEQHSTTLTLTNPSDTLCRVFALWHVDQRISVDVLTFLRAASDQSLGQPGSHAEARSLWWIAIRTLPSPKSAVPDLRNRSCRSSGRSTAGGMQQTSPMCSTGHGTRNTVADPFLLA